MPGKTGSVKPDHRYGHLKESFRKQGKSDVLAEQLAAQTVDRRRVPRGDGEASPRDGMAVRPAARPQDEAPRRKR